jgi:hypothetical protein
MEGSDGGMLLEEGSELFGDIVHFGELSDALCADPGEDLFGAVFGLVPGCEDFF